MGATTQPALSDRRWSGLKGLSLPAILAVFTLIARVLCRGPLYFADGPEHIASIAAKSYIIQPPGYWMFARIAGLFSDPVLAIAVMNISFSVAGVVVFYYTALFFTNRVNAFLAALAYSTVFYIWFSGEVHSTYASQILFPAATYLVLLCYERQRSQRLIWIAALVFAVGAGLRPTDGAFLIPMLLYFAAFRMPRRDALLFLSLDVLFCLGWLIPTWFAFARYDLGAAGFAQYVAFITTKQSMLTGFRMYTLANPVRYILPLIAGFWPILGIALTNMVRTWSDWRTRSLVLWIVPGSLFFVLVLMACAPYLNFLTPAIFLLALMVPRPSLPRWLVVTAVWNAFFFLALGPIPSHKLPMNILNSFVLRCTRGGIEQRYNTILTQMQHLDNAQ
ncbi:MAG: glycosyltransferase family 39 protein [Terracidiphilus sp.]